jgi:hypothetical protein
LEGYVSEVKHNQLNAADSNWRLLYTIGSVAALIMLVCATITMIVVLTLGGEPGTADEYFTLLQDNRLVGILRMDLASLISVSLYYLLFISLYAALRQTDSALALLAAALAFAGVTLFLSRHSAFSMLSLSDQYMAATTEAQRSQLLVAGEAVIASDVWHSSAALIGGILFQSAAVLISAVMLRSEHFNKATAYVGIAANGIDLVRILINLFAPGNPADILMIVAGPHKCAWPESPEVGAIPTIGESISVMLCCDSCGAARRFETKLFSGWLLRY